MEELPASCEVSAPSRERREHPASTHSSQTARARAFFVSRLMRAGAGRETGVKCRNRRIQVVSQSISQFRRNPPRAHRAFHVRFGCPCVPCVSRLSPPPPVAGVFLHVHDLTSPRGRCSCSARPACWNILNAFSPIASVPVKNAVYKCFILCRSCGLNFLLHYWPHKNPQRPQRKRLRCHRQDNRLPQSSRLVCIVLKHAHRP